MFVTSFDLHSQSTHNVWSEVLKTEGDSRSLRLSTLASRLLELDYGWLGLRFCIKGDEYEGVVGLPPPPLS